MVNLTDFKGDKVCFGYIEKDHVVKITSNPAKEHAEDAYAVCTDGTVYPAETSICTGEMNTTQGETFSVTIDD